MIVIVPFYTYSSYRAHRARMCARYGKEKYLVVSRKKRREISRKKTVTKRWQKSNKKKDKKG